MSEIKQGEAPKKRLGFFEIPDELKEEITGKIPVVSINQEYKKLHDVMKYQWARFVEAYKESLKPNGIVTGYRDVASQIAVFASILSILGISESEAMTAATGDAVLNYLNTHLTDEVVEP
jgi:hypothetical protein